MFPSEICVRFTGKMKLGDDIVHAHVATNTPYPPFKIETRSCERDRFFVGIIRTLILTEDNTCIYTHRFLAPVLLKGRPEERVERIDVPMSTLASQEFVASFLSGEAFVVAPGEWNEESQKDHELVVGKNHNGGFLKIACRKNRTSRETLDYCFLDVNSRTRTCRSPYGKQCMEPMLCKDGSCMTNPTCIVMSFRLPMKYEPYTQESITKLERYQPVKMHGNIAFVTICKTKASNTLGLFRALKYDDGYYTGYRVEWLEKLIRTWCVKDWSSTGSFHVFGHLNKNQVMEFLLKGLGTEYVRDHHHRTSMKTFSNDVHIQKKMRREDVKVHIQRQIEEIKRNQMQTDLIAMETSISEFDQTISTLADLSPHVNTVSSTLLHSERVVHLVIATAHIVARVGDTNRVTMKWLSRALYALIEVFTRRIGRNSIAELRIKYPGVHGCLYPGVHAGQNSMGRLAGCRFQLILLVASILHDAPRTAVNLMWERYMTSADQEDYKQRRCNLFLKSLSHIVSAILPTESTSWNMFMDSLLHYPDSLVQDRTRYSEYCMNPAICTLVLGAVLVKTEKGYTWKDIDESCIPESRHQYPYFGIGLWRTPTNTLSMVI